MKPSKHIILFCVFFVALTAGTFLDNEVFAAGAPASIVLSPNPASVIVGQKVSFTATVYDANRNKLTGVPIAWSLTSPVAGCTIDQNGLLKAAANTVPGTYANLVKVAVASKPTVFARAQVAVSYAPFTGGVFIGTAICSSGCGQGQGVVKIAMHATSSSFKCLAIDSGGLFQQFSGTIDKNGHVGAIFRSLDNETITITGNLKRTGGLVTSVSGTWRQTGGPHPSSGTWNFPAAHRAGSGPKVGAWSIPSQKQSPSGGLAVIFNDNYTFSACATHRENGQLDGDQFSGTWTGGAISFRVNSSGNVARGDGLYTSGKGASGHLYNGKNQVIGTWSVLDQ